MTFENLGINPLILKALKEQGYEKPTPIQAQAIPILLKGKDLLGCAQTGTGKTCAFAVPIIQLMAEAILAEDPPKKKRSIRALILSPTRELALQIDESFSAYGKHIGLRNTVVFGGVNQNSQTRALNKGIDILTATPGRLLDLMGQGFIDLSEVQWFVLDEADRMLDMGFVHDIRKVVRQLPKERQSLFFSATLPFEIVELSHDILGNPEKVAVDPPASTAELVDQLLYYVDPKIKRHLLVHLLQDEKIESALVFTRTKHGANKLVKMLTRAGINADAIHGNKSQNARQKALQGFKDKEIRVLVATDIAARGIDVDDLTHVFNYELPNIPETYIHRIGRTGRAGLSGIAISFCAEDEKPYLRDIQRLIGTKITVVEDHPFTTGNQVEEPENTGEEKRGPNTRRSNPNNRGGSGGGSNSGRNAGGGGRNTGRKKPAIRNENKNEKSTENRTENHLKHTGVSEKNTEGLEKSVGNDGPVKKSRGGRGRGRGRGNANNPQGERKPRTQNKNQEERNESSENKQRGSLERKSGGGKNRNRGKKRPVANENANQQSKNQGSETQKTSPKKLVEPKKEAKKSGSWFDRILSKLKKD